MTAPQAEDPKPKRMNPRRLRQTMYWLALDWIHLRTDLGLSTGAGAERTSNVKDYGHPAEWASDTARDIVDKLSEWHDFLAEERKETRPPTGVVFGTKAFTDQSGAERAPFRARVHSAQTEQRRLVKAWVYLEPRCEQLVELVEAEALKELPDLHHRIRRTLGQYAPKYTIPVPCPNDECGLRTLMRVLGMGQEFITCDACGYTIKEMHYPLLIRMTLDAFIAANPQVANCTDTVTVTDTSVSVSPNPQRRHHRHWGFLAC